VRKYGWGKIHLINFTKGGNVGAMKKKLSETTHGVLYLVSTPIGNLEDITLRALKVLKEVDLIAAEDTRRAKKLLNYYQIKTPATSYFEHSSFKKTQSLLSQLKRGRDIALISEAGTPAISDPGYNLIKLTIENQLKVIPIPGASALIAALSASGLPTNSFVFEGFIPRKTGKRQNLFLSLRDQPRTLIFYESARRLLSTLKDILEILGDRKIVIARELTKIFEEMIRGKTSEVIQLLKDKAIKGELTILVSGDLPPPKDHLN